MGLNRKSLFKPQKLVKGFSDQSVKHICHEAGVTGPGMNNYLRDHVFRALMTSLLIDAGHTDSSITLWTSHTNTTALVRYHNLFGKDGLRQQNSLFQATEGTNISDNPSKKVKISKHI